MALLQIIGLSINPFIESVALPATYICRYMVLCLYACVHILGHHLSIRASIIYKPTCLSVNIPSITTNPSGNQSLLPFLWLRQRSLSVFYFFFCLPPCLSLVPLGAGFHYKCNNFKPAFCNTTTTTQMHNKHTSLTPNTSTNTFAHQVTVTHSDRRRDKHRFYGRNTERARVSFERASSCSPLSSSPLSVWLSCCVVVVVVCCSRGCWRSVFAASASAGAAALSHVQSWQHAHTPLRTHRHRQWVRERLSPI